MTISSENRTRAGAAGLPSCSCSESRKTARHSNTDTGKQAQSDRGTRIDRGTEGQTEGQRAGEGQKEQRDRQSQTERQAEVQSEAALSTSSQLAWELLEQHRGKAAGSAPPRN